MSQPFIGQISIFGGNFAPRGWAFCNGQLLNIASNTALFSIFGTIYGGDGRQTFGLPDLRGRVPISAGAGPGLTNRKIGEKSGAQSVAVNVNQMASHGHIVRANTGGAAVTTPTGNSLAMAEAYLAADANTDMRAGTTTNVGGGQAVDNMEPFLVLNYIVALVGIYPSRN